MNHGDENGKNGDDCIFNASVHILLNHYIKINVRLSLLLIIYKKTKK